MQYKQIRILLIGANLWYIGEGMFGPLLSVYTQRIGGDILDLTGAWSVYLLVTGLCMLAVSASSYLAGVALDLGVAPRTFAAGLGLIMLLPTAAWMLAIRRTRDV